MHTIKLREIGNSVGVVLPKDVLSRLKADAGDQLYLVETPDGYQITRYDPAFAKQMDAARAVMREHSDVLRELAK